MIPEAWLTLMKFAPVLSSKTLATAIMQNWQLGARIVFNDEYQKGSSIAFYTNQQILLLNGKVTGMSWGAKYPDVPPVFIDEAEFLRLWNSAERVFLFTENDKKDKLPNGLQGRTLIDQSRKTILVNQ